MHSLTRLFDAGSGGGGGAASTVGGGAGCTPNWSCSVSEVTNGQGTRSCLDSNVGGITAGKPDEGPTALPSLDLNFYKCRVQPVVDLTCAMTPRATPSASSSRTPGRAATPV